MNVLYLHDRPSGGAGESLYRLVRGRQGQGKSVVVFGGPGFVRERFDALGLDPPPVYHRAHSWLARRWPDRSGLSAVWRLAMSPFHLPLLVRVLGLARQHQVDVIHTNCVYLIEGAVAARLLGVPHVWHVRELIDLECYQYAWPKRAVTRCLQRLSDVLLCNSRRTAEGLAQLQMNPATIRVIPNIVDPPATRNDLRAHLGLDPGVRLIGVVGWMRSVKRVEDFIAVASRLADLGDRVRFVVIGGWGTDGAYNDRIKQAIRASSNVANIVHTGLLRGAETYMASLDVLICPCAVESFGRTVAEALAVGTPAIGVRGCAVAEIIDHGETGFLVGEGDVAAMAEHTRFLLADPERRRRFGDRATRSMQARFSSTVLVPRFEALYRDLRAHRHGWTRRTPLENVDA